MHQNYYPISYHQQPPKRHFFYNSYLQTYIERDLREIYGISQVHNFHHFVLLCAARTGQIINFTDLARDTGVSVNTIRSWISILESTFLIYLLQPYHSNFSKRIIKSPKLYFLDLGLATYLTKWHSKETVKNGAMAGAFFESFIISEIIKSYLYRGLIHSLYYFRDKEGHEVDLLIEKEQFLYPVEIKIASQIRKRHIQGLDYFMQREKKVAMGAIVCLSPERYRLKHNLEVVSYQYIT